jgi:hypothetical protein
MVTVGKNYSRARKGNKLDGRINVDEAQVWVESRRPREGASAKLSREGTYKDKIQILYCKRRDVMH